MTRTRDGTALSAGVDGTSLAAPSRRRDRGVPRSENRVGRLISRSDWTAGASLIWVWRSGDLLLVVLLLDVDRPDVVMGAEDVLDGQHRRVHRVVLVVVLVHAVATDRMHVGRVLARTTAQRRPRCRLVGRRRRSGRPSASARRSRPRRRRRRRARGCSSSRLPCVDQVVVVDGPAGRRPRTRSTRARGRSGRP